jgi:hypothetical protein
MSAAALQELAAVLGARTVAYVCGLQSASQVTDAIAGVLRLDAPTGARLQALHETYLVLRRAGDTDDTIRRWFAGSNPNLGDEAPVTVLRAGSADAAVLDAAADFAS